MSAEEMYRQFGDYTRHKWKTYVKNRENFIQEHVNLIEEYNTEVVKGFNKIVGNKEKNYDFKSRPLKIPPELMKTMQSERPKSDVRKRFKEQTLQSYVDQVLKTVKYR